MSADKEAKGPCPRISSTSALLTFERFIELSSVSETSAWKTMLLFPVGIVSWYVAFGATALSPSTPAPPFSSDSFIE